MGRGLRWELPHAILDAIFYALDLTEGNQPKLTSALLASREAENVLHQLKDIIAEGVSCIIVGLRALSLAFDQARYLPVLCSIHRI